MVLYVNGSPVGEAANGPGLEQLGPLVFFGIDFDGVLSADAVRWSPSAETPGLNFERHGVWHGSRMDQFLVYSRVLCQEEIAMISRDPFIMFEPRMCDAGKCPDCGEPVRADPERAPLDPRIRAVEIDGGARQDLEAAFAPRPPAEWCVCTKCGRPCLNPTGAP